MRAITVRQPWAWAIFHGKGVENRSTNVFGSYRGPLAIHAGLAYVEDATLWDNDYRPTEVDPEGDHREPRGAIIGVVDLVDAHHGFSDQCDCDLMADPWPDPEKWHGILSNPREISAIPAKGRLGLWRPAPELVERIEHALRVAAL